MPTTRRRFLTASLTLPAAARAAVSGRHGAVATVHPLATAAARRAMEAGGNAVDGAVAAALMLGVVDGHNSGLGGGMFLLIRTPRGEWLALDGRETAPAAAHRELFVREGAAVPELSRTGALAVAVPSQLAALAAAVERCGRRPLAEPLEAAAAVAAEGFLPGAGYAARVAAVRADLMRFPAAAAMLGDVRADRVLRLPDLAATLRAVAAHGPDWFYRGPFAERVGEWMRANGGILTKDDFAAHRPVWREPVLTRYRGRTVAGFPPPSSGGVHIAQMLQMLERFDLAAMDQIDRAHVLIETMKAAFADRAHWLGDPDFARVPRGLTDPEYAKGLAARIRMDRATPVPGHGEPPRAGDDIFRKHTTHFSVCDDEGWWVAATATVNTTFGSKVVVQGTGVVLNNEMDDFSARPGAPNAFGLVGAEANAVGPGKRPLSSMSPTIVLDAERPVMALGAAGGPTIITQTLQHLVRTIDLGATPADALAAPRLHHQWKPDEVLAETALPEAVAAGLTKRGHRLRREPRIGVAQIVARGADGGLTAAADPRVSGRAEAW